MIAWEMVARSTCCVAFFQRFVHNYIMALSNWKQPVALKCKSEMWFPFGGIVFTLISGSANRFQTISRIYAHTSQTGSGRGG